MTLTLREYQSRMVENVLRAWSEGDLRVLGCLPTGGGKTEVAINLITEHRRQHERALVLVERKVLARQWAARLRRHGVGHVGVLQGENSIGLSAPVIVATAQSIRTRGIPADVGMIVIDESHLWHQTHDKVLQSAECARVLGLTATPLREGLGLRFDRLVTGATIRELIDAGHLVRPRYFAPAGTMVEEALEQVAVRAGDYAADQLAKAMRAKALIGDVVGTWQRRGEDRQTIAFCVDKAHAADLCAEFVAAGVAAEVVVDDTSDEDRERIFAAFDKREVRVLVSVGVLAIGFDSPVASCAILARPTLSTSLHVQQGGRVLRPFDGKVDALILDHAANTLRHGRLEDFEPPPDLSMIDKRTDKRSRREAPESWVCRKCHAINSLHDDCCVECGTPRRRLTTAVVLDGELVELEVVPGEALPGPEYSELHDFYRMAMWHAEHHGIKPGWAYFATMRRFKLTELAARRLIPKDWRWADPLPPDEAAARWFRADYIRSRYAKQHSASRVPA